MEPHCCICWEPFDARDVLAVRCGHVFHADCLLPWLDRTATCPYCRQKATRATAQQLFFSRDGNDSPVDETPAAQEMSRVTSQLEETEKKLFRCDGKLKQLTDSNRLALILT